MIREKLEKTREVHECVTIMWGTEGKSTLNRHGKCDKLQQREKQKGTSCPFQYETA